MNKLRFQRRRPDFGAELWELMSLLFPSYFPEWGQERLRGCGEAFWHGGKLSPLLAPSLAAYILYKMLLPSLFPWVLQQGWQPRSKASLVLSRAWMKGWCLEVRPQWDGLRAGVAFSSCFWWKHLVDGKPRVWASSAVPGEPRPAWASQMATKALVARRGDS